MDKLNVKKGEILMYSYRVREDRKIRVIVNTDAKNEADDQFAIVHACLTPKFVVKGLIGAQFGTRRTTESMQESVDECKKLMELMDCSVPVYCGAREAIKSETEYEYSEGAKLIAEEALKDDEKPLFAIFLGPLTDMACAYLRHPEIAGRLTVIWIGGGTYPEGGWEFNLSNDIKAANVVLQSGLELWQVPMDVYTKMLVSYAELEEKVRPCGKVGRYLFDQMMDFSETVPGRGPWPKGESWSLGDSPTIGLMLDPQELLSHEQEAPVIDGDMKYSFTGTGRKIRVYHDCNVRFILEDLFCKLKLNYGNNGLN